MERILPYFNPNLSVSEFAVLNADVGYAGTVDAVAFVDGQPYVIDFKTSEKAKTQSGLGDYRQQTAAYREAILCRVEELGLDELKVRAK